MRPPLFFLLLLVGFAITSCISEPEAIAPAEPAVDADYTHAYIIEEELPASSAQLFHVFLTTEEVRSAEGFTGDSRAVYLSYLSNGELPAGRYSYTPGADMNFNSADFVQLERYERLDFSTQHSRVADTPWGGIVEVGYEGEQLQLTVNASTNGRDELMVRYQGQPERLELTKLKGDLNLPAGGIDNRVTYGDGEESFEVEAARLICRRVNRTSDELEVIISLTTATNVNDDNARWSAEGMELTLSCQPYHMDDGMFVAQGSRLDFLNKMGSVMTSSRVSMTRYDGGTGDQWRSLDNGDVMVQFDDRTMTIIGQLYDKDGNPVKVAYSGAANVMRGGNGTGE